uniref:Aminopeptidase N n=1 Tax=uncultured bacterium BLR9 TaxID=506525 RepID=C0INB2_9BACT|nr:membrane alanine aminopeptidase N [uncultured bacterium BLR9]
MKTTEPRAIHLKDYAPPSYRIPEIALDFLLDPMATRVTATMKVERLTARAHDPLVLDGNRVKLLSVKIDGVPLSHGAYATDDEKLTLHSPPEGDFTLEICTEIAPAKNTALEGLYMAGGIYCTQCEPEGFRCITYFLDRPDNLARFETRIEGPTNTLPVLLSNGNLMDAGVLPNGRHFACWRDPFPKPCYLFALVAGDLAHIHDHFVTMSGRKVDLRIYVEHGNESRAHYAMDSLKRSMRWDEEAYGREYDLDIFMIVAVSAFNFGAMENKGLNIFNDKVLLASPETATDDDYARIEAVVAHEYFHNWTGDRITCRDWFQLSLKEGLTVFREAGFAGDMRSQAVRRITDVKSLRLRQFQEDAGPLAHPVQPQSYITIDNFYTATVYEKGSEVIGMLHTILGAELFRKGMDLYFERHDGDAATVEDFVRCFEAVSHRDLTQFRLWYRQAGTPEVRAEGQYDAKAGTYALKLAQTVPLTPGQTEKHPMHLPISLGLMGRSTGNALPLTLAGENVVGPEQRVLELTEAEHRFVFTGIAEEPVLSLARNFSAPVIVKSPADAKTRAFLMGRDTDAFNRWEAGQQLAAEVLLAMTRDVQAGKEPAPDPAYIEAIGGVLARADEDHAFAALVLMPPSESEIAMFMAPIDPDAIHTARKALIRTIQEAHGDAFAALYARAESRGAFSPDAASAGRRSLRNACLRFLTVADDEAAAERADKHYRAATNMTEMSAGLAALTRMASPRRDAAFAHFHDRFKDNLLVLDKWMGMQAMSPREDTVEKVRALMSDPCFSLKNPNRVRALVGAFAMGNPLRFHDRSGKGYALLREVLGELDGINPQTAARMAAAFETWRRYDTPRQKLMQGELQTIAGRPNLSANLYEMVTKMLG